MESLEELLRQYDIVTLHVPLSPSTVGLIGAEQLAMMQEQSSFFCLPAMLEWSAESR